MTTEELFILYQKIFSRQAIGSSTLESIGDDKSQGEINLEDVTKKLDTSGENLNKL